MKSPLKKTCLFLLTALITPLAFSLLTSCAGADGGRADRRDPQVYRERGLTTQPWNRPASFEGGGGPLGAIQTRAPEY
jgi:hypothetical protein